MMRCLPLRRFGCRCPTPTTRPDRYGPSVCGSWVFSRAHSSPFSTSSSLTTRSVSSSLKSQFRSLLSLSATSWPRFCPQPRSASPDSGPRASPSTRARLTWRSTCSLPYSPMPEAHSETGHPMRWVSLTLSKPFTDAASPLLLLGFSSLQRRLVLTTLLLLLLIIISLFFNYLHVLF